MKDKLMAQYIDKAALVSELERLYNLEYTNTSNLSCGKKIMLRNILCFLDTLEVKEVDLDYIKDELDRVVKIYKSDVDFGWGTLYNIATHFFELGLKA